MEISPIARRRIRYRISFTADGRRLTLDGWKSVTPRRPVTSMTVLPFTLYEGERRVGEGTLRFPLATGLAPFLASFRFPRREDAVGSWRRAGTASPAAPRSGTPPLTDPATGTGLWLHHELTAPADGSEPFAHGWAAVFPKDGPVRARPLRPREVDPERATASPRTASRAVPGRLTGSAGRTCAGTWPNRPRTRRCSPSPAGPGAAPCCPPRRCFPPRVPRTTGRSPYGNTTLTLGGAPGASARIYGHGNARRWAWLHADLGEGDVLEIVAAVSMRPGLRRLPPLVFLRLRRGGRTWPRRAERTAVGWAGIRAVPLPPSGCPPGR